MPYAQRLAALVAPLEVARDAFESASAALPTGATVGDFERIARPFADAVAKADVELRQVTWPEVALDDIKAELTADKLLEAELVGTLDDTLVVSVWRHQIISPRIGRGTPSKPSASISASVHNPAEGRRLSARRRQLAEGGSPAARRRSKISGGTVNFQPSPFSWVRETVSSPAGTRP